jgi:hypothetical protein
VAAPIMASCDLLCCFNTSFKYCYGLALLKGLSCKVLASLIYI